jgi:hypothetical protein
MADLICAECGGDVPNDPEDHAEAVAELARKFPGFTPEQCAVICDACYVTITARIKAGMPMRH